MNLVPRVCRWKKQLHPKPIFNYSMVFASNSNVGLLLHVGLWFICVQCYLGLCMLHDDDTL